MNASADLMYVLNVKKVWIKVFTIHRNVRRENIWGLKIFDNYKKCQCNLFHENLIFSSEGKQ